MGDVMAQTSIVNASIGMDCSNMRAWYLSDPDNVLSTQQVLQVLGEGAVLYQAPSVAEGNAALDNICKTKHICAEDRLYISPKREDHKSTLFQIGREHKHPDEEVRLFEQGQGYFDVRDPFDRWLRIRVAQGDLLILPAGIYHRFTPASLQEEITVRRLFTDESSWVADFR